MLSDILGGGKLTWDQFPSRSPCDRAHDGRRFRPSGRKCAKRGDREQSRVVNEPGALTYGFVTTVGLGGDGRRAGCGGMWRDGGGGKQTDDVAAFEPALLDLERRGPCRRRW